MLFKRWLHEQVRNSDYRIFKSFYLKVNKNLSFNEILVDRFIFLFRIFIMPVFLRYKNRKKVYKYYVIEKKDVYDLRIMYIFNYTNNKDIGLINSSPKSSIEIYSFNDLYIFFKSYIYAIYSAIKIVILPFNFSILSLSNFFYIRTKLNILKPRKIFIFYSYSPQNYILSLYAANILNIKVDYIIVNMIHELLRYSYFKNIRLCFANNIYLEEYNTIKRIGWIKDERCQHIVSGNERLIGTEKYFPNIDIGFYSSAYWARKDGLYANYNIAALKEDKYKNNIYAKREIIIMNNVIKIAKKNGFSFKLYLHPYEKALIKNHGIYPPYWDKIDLKIVETEELNNINEVKLGVLLQSSIFYDRWANNLLTLCYQFKNPKNKLQIPLKYLGKYHNYGFKNIKDLEKLILMGLEK